MAGVIQLTFTANYTGSHRICWREGSSGAYDCSITVGCTSGNSCTVDIPVDTDNQTCEVREFEGYVQPTCVDEESIEKRVEFSNTFTPVNTCQSYTVTCDTTSVESITVESGGSGYPQSPPPAVTLIGGGGTGATAVAVVNGSGEITEIVITNGGSGYTTAPVVDIEPPSPGTEAVANAVLANCDSFDATDCDGSPLQVESTVMQVGDSIRLCGEEGSPGPGSQYSVAAAGNCNCNCRSVTIACTSAVQTQIRVNATLCNGNFVRFSLNGGQSTTQCFVENSIAVGIETGAATWTETDNGSC